MQTIVVVGYQGRMGSMVSKELSASKRVDYLGGIGSADDLEESLLRHKPDLVIDLTNPSAVFSNAKLYIQHNIKAVIGTTGLTDLQIDQLANQASHKCLGMMILPNFSIGVALMQRCVAEISPYFNHTEIIESHHLEKLDKPSGTALLTQKNIINHSNDGSKAEVNIHSVRLPGILAKQEIVFANSSEYLSLTHQATNRSAFMPGLWLAIDKIKNCDQFIYGLEKVILL